MDTVGLPGTTKNVILNGSSIIDMAVASDGKTIYVAGTVAGSLVLKSTDAGQSFESVQNNYGGAAPVAISVAPDDVNTVAVTDGAVVWITKDGGTTWAALPAPPAGSIRDVAVVPARSGTLLGREYVLAISDPTGGTIAASTALGDVAIIGNTATWTSVAAGITGTRDYTSVAVSPNFPGDRAVVAVGTFTTRPKIAATTSASGGGTGGQPVAQPTIVVQASPAEAPAYIWAVIAIGAIMVIAVIILIVRTRRIM